MYHTEVDTRSVGLNPQKPNSATGTRAALLSLLWIQAGITVLVAVACYLHQHSFMAAVAGLYGGGIGLGASALLGMRVLMASRPGSGFGGMYIGVLERFVFVGAAFAVGIAVLGLTPIAMLAGFAGAQCGYFIAANWVNRKDSAGKDTAGKDSAGPGGQHGS